MKLKIQKHNAKQERPSFFASNIFKSQMTISGKKEKKENISVSREVIAREIKGYV